MGNVQSSFQSRHFSRTTTRVRLLPTREYPTNPSASSLSSTTTFPQSFGRGYVSGPTLSIRGAWIQYTMESTKEFPIYFALPNLENHAILVSSTNDWPLAFSLIRPYQLIMSHGSWFDGQSSRNWVVVLSTQTFSCTPRSYRIKLRAYAGMKVHLDCVWI